MMPKAPSVQASVSTTSSPTDRPARKDLQEVAAPAARCPPPGEEHEPGDAHIRKVTRATSFAENSRRSMVRI